MTWDSGILIVGVAAIAAFVLAFHFSGLIARAMGAVATARETFAVISDETLDDAQKEPLVQKGAVRMFAQVGAIAITVAIVLAAPGVVMWGGDRLDLASFAAVSDFLLSWEVLIGATLVVLTAVWVLRRR